MKGAFIASMFPVVSLVTFGIFPLVMSIVILASCDKFENKGLAIAAGVLGLFVLPIILFIPFAMGFALKLKQQHHQQQQQ